MGGSSGPHGVYAIVSALPVERGVVGWGAVVCGAVVCGAVVCGAVVWGAVVCGGECAPLDPVGADDVGPVDRVVDSVEEPSGGPSDRGPPALRALHAGRRRRATATATAVHGRAGIVGPSAAAEPSAPT
jgi:hypothetical protein